MHVHIVVGCLLSVYVCHAFPVCAGSALSTSFLCATFAILLSFAFWQVLVYWTLHWSSYHQELLGRCLLCPTYLQNPSWQVLKTQCCYHDNNYHGNTQHRVTAIVQCHVLFENNSISFTVFSFGMYVQVVFISIIIGNLIMFFTGVTFLIHSFSVWVGPLNYQI